eukprot:3533113-Pleurochrysis_carterae.AAC.1
MHLPDNIGRVDTNVECEDEGDSDGTHALAHPPRGHFCLGPPWRTVRQLEQQRQLQRRPRGLRRHRCVGRTRSHYTLRQHVRGCAQAMRRRYVSAMYTSLATTSTLFSVNK